MECCAGRRRRSFRPEESADGLRSHPYEKFERLQIWKPAPSLSKLLAKKRAFGLAVAFGKLAVNTVQSTRQGMRNLSTTERKSYSAGVAPNYRQLADLLAELGRLTEAQEVLDLLKDEEYYRFLSVRAGPGADRVNLTSLEREWCDRYERLDAQVAALAAERRTIEATPAAQRTPAQTERLSAIRKGLDEASAAFNAFLKTAQQAFDAANAKSERLEDLKASPSLSRALSKLPGKPAAVYTLVTEDGVRVVASLPSVNLVRQAKAGISAADLNKKILSFREALQNPSLDPRPLGAELYELIVRPIESDLEAAKTDLAVEPRRPTPLHSDLGTLRR